MLSNFIEAYENEKTLKVKIFSQKTQLENKNDYLKQQNENIKLQMLH